jgi:AcrR family transcriptional regulator
VDGVDAPVHVYTVNSKVYNVHMSRNRIFAAAKAVLDREGLPGFTVRKVADHAGLSPMAMYRHFADKDALLNALMDDGLATWEEIARSIHVTDPIEWLTELSEGFLNFALTEPHRFDAAFFLPAPRARQYPDDFVAGRSPVVAMATVRIEQAKASGRLGDEPALDVALAFAALAQGLVSMFRAGRFSGEKQFRTVYRAQIRHCLDGFRKPAGRDR